MKAITPEKEIPPAHRTAASGMFPTEQTKLRIAISGPTSTFSAVRSTPGASVRNTALKTLPGRTATKPAITKPAVISFQSICQSPRKLWGDVRPRLNGGHALAPAELARRDRVHVPGVGLLGVGARALLLARRDERP